MMANTPPRTPALSILVVSYNTRQMTLDCLESVFRQTTETDFELIVIDNASQDGSAEAIAAAFPQVRLIASPDNLGFARANNVAAEEARGAYLLLLNPDTLVLDGAIDKLMQFARARPEAKIWGGRTVFADGSLNPTSCWRAPSLWSLFCLAAGLNWLFPRSPLFNSEAYGGWLRDEERAVDIVTGCFFLIPTALWRALGGFDLTFVMYAEEADLCLRARANGACPRITPDAQIVHYGGASEPARADKVIRILRARVSYFSKHWSGVKLALGLALLRHWPLMRHAVLSARAMLRGAASQNAWSEVWRRRREWWSGFPDAS